MSKHRRKRRREREISDSEDSEEDLHARYRRPGNDYQNYNMYEDRYNGWQDIYRPDYYERGRSRGYEPYRRRNNYYDDYQSSYYDDYDDYSRSSHSNCRACSSRKRRGGPSYDSYAYRYEEGSGGPKRRKEPRKSRKAKHVDAAEENAAGGERDINVYAVPDVSGQDGFKDETKKEKKRNKVRTPESSDSEREQDSRHRVRRRRRRRYMDDDW